jgi:glycosyltransferase involved in cell wall biosynthesis
MKVLAWVPQPPGRTPGQRFRIEQWTPHLAREAIEVVFSPFSDAALGEVLGRTGQLGKKAWGVAAAWWRRLHEAATRIDADLVYVFREGSLVGPALAERLLVSRVPFVFDFDDAVWVRYLSPANSYLSYLRFPGKTSTLCRLARHVLAGNRYLADYASRYNQRVSIVPTTIDTALYVRSSGDPGNPPVIGWTGSFSTLAYLSPMRAVFRRLRERRPFRVKVVGGTGFAVDGVPIECKPWAAATEVEDIADFDIGIMPLPDAEWERGKCGLKALQYMALGIPAVVSPIGVNREIVEPGRTGFHATTEDEWVDALDRLLDSVELRRRMGAAGRAMVEERYSAAVVAPRVAEIFRSASS